jgi:hypothetical protein
MREPFRPAASAAASGLLFRTASLCPCLCCAPFSAGRVESALVEKPPPQAPKQQAAEKRGPAAPHHTEHTRNRQLQTCLVWCPHRPSYVWRACKWPHRHCRPSWPRCRRHCPLLQPSSKPCSRPPTVGQLRRQPLPVAPPPSRRLHLHCCPPCAPCRRCRHSCSPGTPSSACVNSSAPHSISNGMHTHKCSPPTTST